MMALLMGVGTISPADVSRLAREGAARVFDVNLVPSWQRHHVPGAVHLDHATFEADDLPASRDTALVFYCSNPFCRKAPLAARRAKRFGYANVRVMSAGIQGWLDEGLPTESAGAEPARP